jgi:hypothetical protein
MSYAEVLTTARQKIPLAEVGIETVKMRKAMTGAIILEVPGNKDRGKASSLATRLAQIGAACGRGRHVRRQRRAAKRTGFGGRMWRRGSASRRDWLLQRRPRVGLDKLPGGWSA